MQPRYRIYKMSAKTILSYANETAPEVYSFDLNKSSTERCKIYTANHEQEDNALLFQTMCVLHGDSYAQPDDIVLIEDLSDIICVIDFAEIFDRDSNNKKFALRQKKAESMFRPEGISLNFGNGSYQYVAFERSASMSRNAQLTFIRKDFYEPVGRFTFDSIIKHEGLMRVLTIIARGYLWSSDCDTDYTRRALCAWCSIPDRKNTKPKEDCQYKSDFRELHAEFPELVDKNGKGWFYRHVHNIADFIKSNPDKVSVSAAKQADILDSVWNAKWREKVIQFQLPIFSPTTKGSWILRFDDIIAEALESRALRNKDINLPDDIIDKISDTASDIRKDVIPTLICYYIENRQSDTDWVVMPVSNFDAYFGTTTFSKKLLSKIPESIIIRDKQTCGICRYKVTPEYLP